MPSPPVDVSEPPTLLALCHTSEAARPSRPFVDELTEFTTGDRWFAVRLVLGSSSSFSTSAANSASLYVGNAGDFVTFDT